MVISQARLTMPGLLAKKFAGKPFSAPRWLRSGSPRLTMLSAASPRHPSGQRQLAVKMTREPPAQAGGGVMTAATENITFWWFLHLGLTPEARALARLPVARGSGAGFPSPGSLALAILSQRERANDARFLRAAFWVHIILVDGGWGGTSRLAGTPRAERWAWRARGGENWPPPNIEDGRRT